MPKARGSFEWIRPPERIADDLEAWAQVKIYSRAERRANALAAEITSWMQDNAPWEDRTGEARRTLHVDVVRQGHNLILTLAHGVEYGIWLELMQQGRFSIVIPATTHFGPLITDRLLGN